MFTSLQARLKKASRWLPVALLPFGAYAQNLNYFASNAVNVAGTYADLGAAGTLITTANTDDANSAAQNIGFTFTYNGTAFTQFILNTNGLIKLGSTAPATAALFFENFNGGVGIDPLTAAGAAETNLLMPFNFDLQQGTAAAEYRVATTGTAPNRVCTIQWKNVSDKSEAGTGAKSQFANFSFQAKLYESGNIEFVYGPATASANAVDTRFPNVGLKGASTASNQLVLALKLDPATAWSTTTFISQNYGQQAHNVSRAGMPDAGRTYRFVPGADTAPALVNDEPGAAVNLPLATTCTPVTGTTVGASTTTATGYVNPGCGIALTPKDVWFKFTTAASGVGSTDIGLQVTGSAAGQVRVFSAASSAGPFTELACATASTNNTVAGPIRLSFLAPNTTYYVFVSGFGSNDTQGPFTICATALATPPPAVYTALPYNESFEGPWVNELATRDVPTNNWRNYPALGDNSWRREDDGFASAGWRYADNESPTTNFPTPPYVTRASTGAHSARFHTFGSAAGQQGKLDLFVNMTGAGSTTLSFDYINPSGTDKLDVFLSTDGGNTFGATPILTATTNTTFTTKTVAIASTSATTVIRFQATSDFGDDDIGMDNLQLRVLTATRNDALAATVGLYPNPARGSFTLSVPAGRLHTASATLVNALGQAVQQRQLNLSPAGGNLNFDTSNLAPGVYMLQLKTSADLVVKQVVIQ
ncbi:T9SS type A sorting domain-containing protein [Hymenobacter sp. BT683]|uniref:T9SS type A sorting domain-containing protein n=1 Tax=Hymenobacter jeongseonensis TaxID=2791027 RepID=A0ABS0IDG6_9BACT|nr:T9SS type A sorting domain-containing protein [Hymenobacter jeongseonensis]MBF9236368.1 T9SS type A sorting domain-containing protein [Hymenobacter jeongseonensis]